MDMDTDTEERASMGVIVAAAGGPAKLARALGLTTSAVCQWRRVPTDRLVAVAEITGIRPERIRPDLAALWRA